MSTVMIEEELTGTPAGLIPAPRGEAFGIKYVHDLRNETLPPAEVIIPMIAHTGVWPLVGGSGVGKSYLAQTLAYWLGEGTYLGGMGEPDEKRRVLIMDSENDNWIHQSRGWNIAKPGTIRTDDPTVTWDGEAGIALTVDEYGEPCMPGHTTNEKFMNLKSIMQESAEDGHPIGMVILDSLYTFLGPPPQGTTRDFHEMHWLNELNVLGREMKCLIMPLHHPSGSKASAGSHQLMAKCTGMLMLERIPNGERDKRILRHEKNRVDGEMEFALLVGEDGVPRFTDTIIPSEVRNGTAGRALIEILKGGPKTASQLESAGHGMSREAVKSALRRLAKTGDVEFNSSLTPGCRGRYSLLNEKTPPPFLPDAINFGDVKVCQLATCGKPLLSTNVGNYHPVCKKKAFTAPPEPTPEEHPDDAKGMEDEEVEQHWNADVALMKSIKASRMNPLPNLWDKMDQAPFNLMHEQMDGQHHRWRPEVKIPEGSTVSILDRRKSYLSTASAVSVAVNRLAHTGPLSYGSKIVEGDLKITLPAFDELDHLGKPKLRAGLFQITPVEWTDNRIAHPLGWTAGNGIDPVWVTTPHLEFLVQLHNGGDLAELPTILDSWTGLRVTNLFKQFGQEAKDVLANGGPEAVADLKVSYGKAVRKLWPKNVQSLTCRPDWHQSWEAEAAIRNWVVAYKAVKAGHTLLRIANVDATHWVSPADADATWCPDNYSIGPSFGDVAHKDDVKVPLVDDVTGKFVRDANGVVKTVVASPLTTEQYGRI